MTVAQDTTAPFEKEGRAADLVLRVSSHALGSAAQVICPTNEFCEQDHENIFA